MAATDYVRLRQICLATSNIRKAEATLSTILGLKVCHRARLPQFGLENIMFAVNGAFLEIVAPVEAGTAVDRFLTRNHGRGGYMAIFDCADVAIHRALATAAGIDAIFERKGEKAELLQLNPRQTGATMMEFDHHYGGDDLFGAYGWAGEDWQDFIDTGTTRDILGIEISSPKAGLRAALWAGLCDRRLSVGEPGIAEIKLDYGTITFRQADNTPAELLRAIDLTVADRRQMLRAAEKAGLAVSDSSFDCCGVEFRLYGVA